MIFPMNELRLHCRKFIIVQTASSPLMFLHIVTKYKKALRSFYHKNIFYNRCLIHLLGVLHSFSIKNIFYDQMDLSFFIFV